MVTPLRASVASWLKGQRSSFQFPKCVGPDAFAKFESLWTKERSTKITCHVMKTNSQGEYTVGHMPST